MIQRKLFFFIGSVLMLLTSCNNDEIDALNNRLKKVERSLGTNEPLTMEFTTTNNSEQTITINRTFLFRPGGDYEYMEDNQDGTYWVYIERFGDVEWSEGAWFRFLYNPTTKEITNKRVGFYGYTQHSDWIDLRFDPVAYVGNTLDISITEFNPATGKISLTAEASTTTASQNNEFSGKPMSGKFKFKGTLPVFYSGDM